MVFIDTAWSQGLSNSPTIPSPWCRGLWQRREGRFAVKDEAGFLRVGPRTEKLGGTQGACQPQFPWWGLWELRRRQWTSWQEWLGWGQRYLLLWKAGSLGYERQGICIRPQAKGIWNWVAETAVSELWKLGMASVLSWKCKQGLPLRPPVKLFARTAPRPRVGASVPFTPVILGVYILWRWRLTKAVCTRLSPFKNSGGRELVVQEEGWRVESPVFWPASATQAAAVFTCWKCVGGGKATPVSWIASQGGC